LANSENYFIGLAMYNIRHNIKPEELESYAWEYINECINHKREQPTASGKVVYVTDRHLPTIAYFLKIWLPMKGLPTLCRSTYYNWLNSEDISVIDTIKNIEGMFTALAVDIVANEGKGIFYAKNKLGMHDRQPEIDEKFKPILITANFGQTIHTSNADQNLQLQ
jgi:hypothetical protein